MQRLLSDNLWPEITRLARKAKRRLAAVAYASSVEHITFRGGDMLVVDASDSTVKARQTSRDLLAAAVRAGAGVYHCPGLHAKVFVFDRVAVVGSANLSRSSAADLIEAAVVTDDPSTVSAARQFIERLADASTVVDDTLLKRLRSLPLDDRWVPFSKRGRTRRRRSRDPVTWLVGVREMDDDSLPDEAERAERGQEVAEGQVARRDSEVSWIRHTGESAFRLRAMEGDLVIKLWRAAGRKRVSEVRPHSPIVRRQDEPACARFYVEEFAADDDALLTWKEFIDLLRRAGFTSRIGPTSTRALTVELSQRLHALWPR
jgi:hypothetical protein